jgi:hypothetical protein
MADKKGFTYEDGYEEGSYDGYMEGCRDQEKCVPPWLRRFFWWDKEKLSFPFRPLYIGGTDEYCNPTLGIRVWNGVVFFRYGRKVGTEMNMDCPACLRARAEEEDRRR